MLRTITTALALIHVACESTGPPSSPPPQVRLSPDLHVHFEEVAVTSGLSFKNVSGSADQYFILESMSAGAAFFDYDVDGYLDLLAVNGTTPGAYSPGSRNRLFHNEPADDGSRVFREVTPDGGLGSSDWGMGCAVGDYDNDGDPDVYLTYWGRNQLLRNDEGQFVDVTDASAVGDTSWSSSAAFGDLDGDSLLDLYVVNYVQFDLQHPPQAGKRWLFKGLEVFYGPKGIPPQRDRLYGGAVDGTFTDRSVETGVAATAYPGLGVVFGDYDLDGDLDIYVANDSEPNQLYRNDGPWLFAEIGGEAGVAYTEDGRSQAGMGVHAGDYDNDGDLDLFVTNFSEDYNTLYRNDGNLQFTDATVPAGLDGVVRPFLGFGTAFFDADNDGWLDLFVANGHVYPQLDDDPAGLDYKQRNLLYRNDGGRFSEIGPRAGTAFADKKVSRGAAFGDYDNDGDVDLFVMELNEAPSLLRNDSGIGNSWIGIELEGVDSNRDAIGALVQVYGNDLVQTREVHRAYGFQAQHDPRLVFGLGAAKSATVVIRWPSGLTQTVTDLPVDRYVRIREGTDDYRAGNAVVRALESEAEIASAGENAAATAVALPANLDTAPEHLYEMARSYFAEGRFAASADALEAALSQDPQADGAWFLLGRVYLGLNRTTDATAALKRARALDSSNWRYANTLGVAFRRAGRTRDALSAFRRASQMAPWAPQPHLNLARVYEELGEPHAAEAERALHRQLRPLQHETNLTEDLVAANPRDVRVLVNLGLAYARQGRASDAAAEFRRAVDIDPDNGLALYGLGDALHRQNRFDEAIQAYEGALGIIPDTAAVHASLGMAHAGCGEFGMAGAAFARALELDPAHAAAHFGQGKLHLQEKNASKAINSCGQAVQHQPDFAVAHDCLGKAYAASGRYPEAVAALRRSLELDGRSVEARYTLGAVYHLQDRFDEAVREWERVLQLEPQHRRARQRLAAATERRQ